MTNYLKENQATSSYSNEEQNSLAYLLMEDGFYLLQESGSRIVLTISNPLLSSQIATTYTLETQS
jgi:hypothetical protein